ncbi:ribbon-helix-helix domain-containing protein [Kroppenstedtia sanguinis]|uniref:Ribbon-helix-helix domain-containing protein n=1 Tax=Kroppenstedtia sanguinis TaxID=1380684 RepID=A0ABW4CEH0_9BACL
MKARITIDLPVDLLQWIKEKCKEEGISRNELIKQALEAYRKGDQ